jgi:methyl-accepting chemotaxis protein
VSLGGTNPFALRSGAPQGIRGQRVSAIVGEITAVATEPSAGLGQINTAVTDLDRTTQQDAALVEEGAAAAESLKERVQRLASAASTFKLST